MAQRKIKKTTYPTDIRDNIWIKIEPFLCSLRTTALHFGGRPLVDNRSILNAIFYVLKTGCAWRCLPSDFPKWQTVYARFRKWCKSDAWIAINEALIADYRGKMKRNPKPSGAIIDSQSVKTTTVGGTDIGIDGNKKIKGRKRFILVDTAGHLLAAHVCAANSSEQAGAQTLIKKIAAPTSKITLCNEVVKVWADAGYRGETLKKQAKETLGWDWEVVHKSENSSFEVQPKRWVVERTIAWFSNYRRLSKDYERLPIVSENMLYVASIFILSRRA